MEALQLLSLSFRSTSPDSFAPILIETSQAWIYKHCVVSNNNSLLQLISRAITDPFYKISGEGLSCATTFAPVVRPDIGAILSDDAREAVLKVYSATLAKLVALDVDQEVKERAITATASLVSYAGDEIGARIADCWPVLIARLQNEVSETFDPYI